MSEKKNIAQKWSRGTGYHECFVDITGERAKRVHYNDPEGFDALVAKHWRAFYEEMCTMNDAAIPVKKKKEAENDDSE